MDFYNKCADYGIPSHHSIPPVVAGNTGMIPNIDISSNLYGHSALRYHQSLYRLSASAATAPQSHNILGSSSGSTNEHTGMLPHPHPHYRHHNKIPSTPSFYQSYGLRYKNDAVTSSLSSNDSTPLYPYNNGFSYDHLNRYYNYHHPPSTHYDHYSNHHSRHSYNYSSLYDPIVGMHHAVRNGNNPGITGRNAAYHYGYHYPTNLPLRGFEYQNLNSSKYYPLHYLQNQHISNFQHQHFNDHSLNRRNLLHQDSSSSLENIQRFRGQNLQNTSFSAPGPIKYENDTNIYLVHDNKNIDNIKSDSNLNVHGLLDKPSNIEDIDRYQFRSPITTSSSPLTNCSASSCADSGVSGCGNNNEDLPMKSFKNNNLNVETHEDTRNFKGNENEYDKRKQNRSLSNDRQSTPSECNEESVGLSASTKPSERDICRKVCSNLRKDCVDSTNSTADVNNKQNRDYHARFTSSKSNLSPAIKENSYFASNISNDDWFPYSNKYCKWSSSKTSFIQRKRAISPTDFHRKYRNAKMKQISKTPPIVVNKYRVLECDFIPSKKSKRKRKSECEFREEIKDIKPLPGFQQAFGSTEIGKFSETFFHISESPNDVFHGYESEADTMSPYPWESGDSLEGPHFNLHIGASLESIYSGSSIDSQLENCNYFRDIR